MSGRNMNGSFEDVFEFMMSQEEESLPKMTLNFDLDESSRDSGFGSDDDIQVSESESPDFGGHFQSLIERPGSELFPASSPALDRLSPNTSHTRKRSRSGADLCHPDPKRSRRQLGDSCTSEALIKSALSQAQQADLIGDFSKECCLPTIQGKHRDLKTISPATLKDVLSGNYADVVEKVTVVDSRYPYEFEGGHIKDAVNIWERQSLKQMVINACPKKSSDKRHIVVFHCEFSSERGPKMLRFLREMDREANKESYPALCYPELYILEGGYKAFFEHSLDHLEPASYRPMLHKEFVSELKHFRSKSKISKRNAVDEKTRGKRQSRYTTGISQRPGFRL